MWLIDIKELIILKALIEYNVNIILLGTFCIMGQRVILICKIVIIIIINMTNIYNRTINI